MSKYNFFFLSSATLSLNLFYSDEPTPYRDDNSVVRMRGCSRRLANHQPNVFYRNFSFALMSDGQRSGVSDVHTDLSLLSVKK